MLSTIEIKQITLQDVDNFFNLRLEALSKSPTSFVPTYDEEKNNGSEFYKEILKQETDKNIIIGAFFNKNLIGIIGIYQEKWIKLNHRSTIWGFYVTPEFRNHGVGKLLINEAISHAKNRMQCKIINLCVESKNEHARQLYESFGFKTWGTEPKSFLIDNKFYDEDHMILILKDKT